MIWDISRTAHILRNQGISKKSKVAIFVNDSAQSIETFFAITKIGATALILKKNLSKEQILSILQEEKPDAVFIDESEKYLADIFDGATIIETSNDKILKYVERDIVSTNFVVSGYDNAAITYQLNSDNQLVKNVYTHKVFVDAVHKMRKAKAKKERSMNTILEYASSLILPMLNGLGVVLN